ncbi:MAG: CPBP family intramembrane metalloprotease [Myxococcales bacterium]|nr:CPBP family intramembrane metalloprotease [Myxococcales bacterium]MCB9755521.1 CPBP family intramembrane metalloprotease [Myxococcales bacterium]
MSRHDEPSTARAPRATGGLLAHFSARQDPFTSALQVFPLFLIYQIGILMQGGRGHNGVDFLTRTLIELCARDLDHYLLTLASLFVAYGCLLLILRPRGRFRSESFIPVLLESVFYATTMGTLILCVMQWAQELVPTLAIGSLSSVDVIVISAGAGLHEELVFRLIGMAGLGWLLTGVTGPRRAWLLALVGSSLLFSVAHHVGPGFEAFSFTAFVYRALAGAFFGLVYHLRGFSVAAWTHALYDVYVLTLA